MDFGGDFLEVVVLGRDLYLSSFAKVYRLIRALPLFKQILSGSIHLLLHVFGQLIKQLLRKVFLKKLHLIQSIKKLLLLHPFPDIRSQQIKQLVFILAVGALCEEHVGNVLCCQLLQVFLDASLIHVLF